MPHLESLLQRPLVNPCQRADTLETWTPFRLLVEGVQGMSDNNMDDLAVIPHLASRAYLAEGCSNGEYNRSEYAALKLLGKTLRYSVDLSG